MQSARLLLPMLCAITGVVFADISWRSDRVAPAVVPAAESSPSSAGKLAHAEATTATASDAPKIAFDRLECDLGVMRQQDRRTATFIARNEGRATLYLSARGQCGCTAVTVSSGAVEPGATSTITVSIATNRLFGAVSKSVYVTSSDPANPQTTLTARADVSAGILLGSQGFYFDAGLAGSRPTASIDVQRKDSGSKSFRVTSVEATDLQPSAAKVVFEAVEFDAAPWHGYRVTARFTEPPPVGFVWGSAVIHTDDQDTPTLEAPIGGTISARVSLDDPTPSFGSVREGEGRTIITHVRPFNASIDLGTVTATSQKGAVTARVTADPTLTGTWTLEIGLPSTTPPGTIDDVIELTTGVRGEESIAVPVSGSVAGR